MHNTHRTPQTAKREFAARHEGRIRRNDRRAMLAAKRAWLDM